MGEQTLSLARRKQNRGSSESFGKNVCYLVKCGQVLKCDVLVGDLFPDEVKVYLNMLSTCMEHWIGG
jgi:hypothetical protein